MFRAAAILTIAVLAGERLAAQQSNPMGGTGRSAKTHPEPAPPLPVESRPPDPRLAALDSVVYRVSRASRLTVKTGKAGLLGFAGHTHLIEARAFEGRVVYYPKNVTASHVEITVVTDSLEVLTPPDTAEIRKVTATMRTDVLRTAEYHEIRLVSREITPRKDGFHLLGALTLVGRTREVPVDLGVQLGLDTLRVGASFSVKQTDFGIKPYSGGPGGTVKVADRVTFYIDLVGVRLVGTS